MLRPLKGLTVIELGSILAAPAAAALLGDLGADVIKVEPPGGDGSRDWWPETRQGGESAHYVAFNRSKRGMVIDLKNPRGKEIYLKLAAKADVIIDNYRVGASDRLGLGYQAVKAINPDIVYGAITGFGLTGPRATEGATDQLAQAFSGLMSLTGDERCGPARVPNSAGDYSTAFYCVIGILSAIRHRDQTGEGALIETSLLDSHLAMLTQHFAVWQETGKMPKPIGSRAPFTAPYQAFRARDAWVVLGCLNDAMFVRACAVLGVPDLPKDERFTSTRTRVLYPDDLEAVLAPLIARFEAADFIKTMNDAGVMAVPINNLEMVINDPQVVARGGLASLNHPVAGEMKVPRLAIRIDHQTPDHYAPAPRFGEHSREILAELGYDRDAIESLVAAKAVIAL
ncbi:MAG: CoA transferase [Alphaproteobacteria bacterium]